MYVEALRQEFKNIRNVPAPLIFITPEGLIVAASPLAEQLIRSTGYRDTLVDRLIPGLLQEQSPGALRNLFRQTLRAARNPLDKNPVQITVSLPDGTEKIIEADVGWVYGGDGTTRYGFSALFRDVTEREEETRSIQALAEMAPLLEASRNVEDILNAVVPRIARLVPHDTGTFMLLEQEAGRVTDASLRLSWDWRTPKGKPPQEPPSPKIIQTLQDISDGKNLLIYSNVRDYPDRWDFKGREWVKCYMAIPIPVNGSVIAVVNFNAARPHAYRESHQRRVVQLGQLLEATFQRLHDSHRDLITGLPDESVFNQVLSREIQRAQRAGNQRRVSVLYLDIDDFKWINDTYGHSAGDEYLRLFAEALLTIVRNLDLVARLHGEEFAVVIPDTDVVGALHLSERILRMSSKLAMEFHAQKNREPIMLKMTGQPPGTVSIGVSSYPADGESAEEVKARADEAMYVAKLTCKFAACCAQRRSAVARTPEEIETLLRLLKPERD